MTFEISPEYFNTLRKLQKQAWAYLVIVLLVSLMFSINTFRKDFEKAPSFTVVVQIVAVLIFGYIFYYRIVQPAKGISNTISAVEILQDRLVFRTSEFKVPFYQSTTKDVVIFPRDIRIREVNYPLKFIYDLDKPVWKITNEKQELYLILDFFDKNLYSEMAKLF